MKSHPIVQVLFALVVIRSIMKNCDTNIVELIQQYDKKGGMSQITIMKLAERMNMVDELMSKIQQLDIPNIDSDKSDIPNDNPVN